MTRNEIATLVAAFLGACTTQQLAVDPDFAARAEVLRPEIHRDASGQRVSFGPFALEYLAPITSSTIKIEGEPPRATHRFSFELKDRAAEAWDVSCDVQMKWIAVSRDQSVHELSCDISNAGTEGRLPYRLSVSGTGPSLGIKSGGVAQGEPVLDIRSSHAAAATADEIGPLLGFDISHENRVLATVQTVDPVTVWIERASTEELRSLAAATAVALSLYERISSGG